MDKRKNKKEIVVVDNSGKVIPSDPITEHYILGAILLSYKDKYAQQIIQAAKPEHFNDPNHRIVYNAIRELFEQDAPIDILSVVDYLRHSGELDQVGGAYFVSILTNGVASTANITYWFYHIIYPLYLRRKIIEIGAMAQNRAYDDTCEVFEELDALIEELSECKPDVMFKPSHTAKSIADELLVDMGLTEGTKDDDELVVGAKKYLTRHKKFNEIVSICANKIVLLASHKAGLKSRIANELVTQLMEDYPDEIACFWVSLEDNRKELTRIWLSRKLHIRPDNIKFGLFDKIFNPTIFKLIKLWESFDLRIWDQGIKIKTIRTQFKQFVAERPGKLCICIIDNVLSLDDHDDYKNNEIGMHEYIGREILKMKRESGGLIFPIHHLNDDASLKSELPNGYRPRLVNIKGSGIWKQVAYQTILTSYPRYYKDLIAQYSGDQKEVLENLWIMDVATNRSHKEIDEESLIRFFVEPDYDLFEEIDDDFEPPEVFTEPIEPDNDKPF